MQSENPSEIEKSWKQLEHVFMHFRNGKAHESNKYPLGHPNRIEHDFTECDKAHLNLLTAKLYMELVVGLNDTISKASDSSDRLGNKVFWLNIALAFLACVTAVCAILELKQ